MVRSFRRGEVIFRAGDPVQHVYLVQSGLVTIVVQRASTVIEVAQVGAHQILGEEALWGTARWTASAVANNDVRILTVELAQAQNLLNSGSPLLKVYLRGVSEKLRACSDTLLESKLESDPTPCAPDRVVKLFATIHTVARYTGTRKGEITTVVWPTYKKYCQRMFLESPVRLEQAVNVLVRLGYAKLEFIPCETDPDAPDELGFVHFSNLDQVQKFQEFYRAKQFGRPNVVEGEAEAEVPEENEAILREIESWNAGNAA